MMDGDDVIRKACEHFFFLKLTLFTPQTLTLPTTLTLVTVLTMHML